VRKNGEGKKLKDIGEELGCVTAVEGMDAPASLDNLIVCWRFKQAA
jgi:hypothetical protein